MDVSPLGASGELLLCVCGIQVAWRCALTGDRWNGVHRVAVADGVWLCTPVLAVSYPDMHHACLGCTLLFCALQVNQDTPVRVLHRRGAKVRAVLLDAPSWQCMQVLTCGWVGECELVGSVACAALVIMLSCFHDAALIYAHAVHCVITPAQVSHASTSNQRIACKLQPTLLVVMSMHACMRLAVRRLRPLQIRPKRVTIEAVDVVPSRPNYFSLTLRTQAGT